MLWLYNNNFYVKLVITLAVIVLASNVLALSGSGSSVDPYLVASASDLDQVSSDINSGRDLTSFYKQTSDIDMSSISNFTPIGNATNAFQGSYDGGGFTISNLTINFVSTDDIGLFGVVNKANISNLQLATSVVVSGNNNVGSLVGRCVSSQFSNVSSGAIVSGSDNVGGIVGDLSYSEFWMNTELTGMVFYGSVSGKNNVGGFFGAFAQSSILHRVTMSKLINLGKVVNSESNIGGIIGNINQSGFFKSIDVTKCVNSGVVLGNNVVGGIIGMCGSGSTTVSFCLNVGYVGGMSDVGVISGSANPTFSNNVFDSQMSSAMAVKGAENDNCLSMLTPNMLGESLKTLPFLPADWAFVAGKYPVLKVFENTVYGDLSALPIFYHYKSSTRYETGSAVRHGFIIAPATSSVWVSEVPDLLQIINDRGVVVRPDVTTEVEFRCLNSNVVRYCRAQILAAKNVYENTTKDLGDESLDIIVSGNGEVNTDSFSTTGYIQYQRTFEPVIWHAFSLPFDVDSITVREDGIDYPLLPFVKGLRESNWNISVKVLPEAAYVDGNQFQQGWEPIDYTTPVLKKNTAYIIRFPDEYYRNKWIVFHSAENVRVNNVFTQMTAPTLDNYYAFHSNATYKKSKIMGSAYKLTTDGRSFLVEQSPDVETCSGYILATDKTVSISPILRLIGDVTDQPIVNDQNKNYMAYSRDMGELCVEFLSETTLKIYALSGVCVANVTGQANEVITLHLPASLYVITDFKNKPERVIVK